MNIQSEAERKHEEILSKYAYNTWHGSRLVSYSDALKAMRELEESLAARTEGDGEGERHFWPYESLRNEIAELKKQLGEQEKIKEGMQLTIDSLIANNDERNSK
jgi:hypothetical protein